MIAARGGEILEKSKKTGYLPFIKENQFPSRREKKLS